MIRALVALLLTSLIGCSHYAKHGLGATTDDRPVHRKSGSRAVWGLVGSKAKKVDVAAVCPHGDALVEESPSLLNYTIIGLFFYRTTVTVYCRDDGYRVARREQRQRQAAEMAEFKRRVDAESAANRARRERRIAALSPPASNYEESAGAQQASPRPAPVRRAERAAGPSSPNDNVRIERRRVSHAASVAKSHQQCDQLIPAVKASDAWSVNVLTKSKREPCHKCVASNKAFSIYGLQPLHSSCD